MKTRRAVAVRRSRPRCLAQGHARSAPLGLGSASPATAGATRRVLIADDESTMRLLLRVNLPLAGFEVVEAADGDDALARAREQSFDLILLDVMMPGLSGFDVAERLRAEPATADVPIVFVSARADEADVRHGLELGAVDYITKPFDPLRLGAHLTSLIDGTHEHDPAQTRLLPFDKDE